jgi:hypothetical protein
MCVQNGDIFVQYANIQFYLKLGRTAEKKLKKAQNACNSLYK